ncbi:MAG: thioredoxin family protein [Bauldia sp.]|uniref:thioredoxin family protein n=1 Tax=Bauldia sp. TaxID=2575872 RepID=UPI001DC559D4|nr:thioredoxin family protein [Bauldia sp.]MCB1496895.1 thioredoxin family protein [Bauldia sp.]
MTKSISRRSFPGLALGGAIAGYFGGGLLIATAGTAAAQPFDQTAFDTARAAGAPILIDVSASWCSTCKAQRAVVTRLVSEPKYAGYTIFVIDYDSQKDLMRKFGARQRSTLIVYKGEAEAGRIVGDTRAEAIEALLAKGV